MLLQSGTFDAERRGSMAIDLAHENMSLHGENSRLRAKIAELKEKGGFQKLLKPLEDRIERLLKQIHVLTENLAETRLKLKIEKDEKKRVQAELRELQKEYKKLEKDKTKLESEELKECRKKLADAEKRLKELQERIDALEGKERIAGVGNSVPSSQRPVGSKPPRVIVNNGGEGDGEPERKRGGQPNHPRSVLKGFPEDQATHKETVEAPAKPGDVCPACGKAEVVEIETQDNDVKQVLDIEMNVIRKVVTYQRCQCPACKKMFRASVDPGAKENVNYGPDIKADMALDIVHNDMSYEKTCQRIYEMSAGKLQPSQGYAAKLISCGAKMLRQSGFAEDLRIATLCYPVIKWDDTVVSINGSQGCMRVYCTEGTVFYRCHRHKDAIGIDEDGVLQYLDETKTVMHDHVLLNYNVKYHFKNAECAVHYQRKFVFVSCSAGYQCAQELKKLIGFIDHERNEAIKAGKGSFSKEEVDSYYSKIRKLLKEGLELIEKDKERYFYSDVKNIFKCGLEFFDSYFGWIEDFSIPVDNSECERLLRPMKSKMKISGCFYSEATGDDFALVRSYVETCYKHGKPRRDALYRLYSGKPYSIKELLPESDLVDFDELKKEILDAEEEARREAEGKASDGDGSAAEKKKNKTDRKKTGDTPANHTSDQKETAETAGVKGQKEEKHASDDSGHDHDMADTASGMDDSVDHGGHDPVPADTEEPVSVSGRTDKCAPGNCEQGERMGSDPDRQRLDAPGEDKQREDSAPASAPNTLASEDQELAESECKHETSKDDIPGGESVQLPGAEKTSGDSGDGSGTETLMETLDRDPSDRKSPGADACKQKTDAKERPESARQGDKTPLPGPGVSEKTFSNQEGEDKAVERRGVSDRGLNPALVDQTIDESVSKQETSEDDIPRGKSAQRKGAGVKSVQREKNSGRESSDGSDTETSAEKPKRDSYGRKRTHADACEQKSKTKTERIKAAADMKVRAESALEDQRKEDAKKDEERRMERKKEQARMRGEYDAIGRKLKAGAPISGAPPDDEACRDAEKRYWV